MNDPHLIAVATATPRYCHSQAEVCAFAARVFSPLLAEEPRLLDIFDNAEISTRYLCIPLEWMEESRTFAQKNARYVE